MENISVSDASIPELVDWINDELIEIDYVLRDFSENILINPGKVISSSVDNIIQQSARNTVFVDMLDQIEKHSTIDGINEGINKSIDNALLTSEICDSSSSFYYDCEVLACKEFKDKVLELDSNYGKSILPSM